MKNKKLFTNYRIKRQEAMNKMTQSNERYKNKSNKGR